MEPFSQVSGEIMLRPVRVGLLLPPEIDAIAKAAKMCCARWGGIHSLIQHDTDIDRAKAVGHNFQIDIFHEVDGNEARKAITRLPGFQWGAAGPWGPFAYDELKSYNLLTSDWLLEDVNQSRAIIDWSEQDPLNGLFSVWFGQYGDASPEQDIAEAYSIKAKRISIPLDGDVPDTTAHLTPILLTGRGTKNDTHESHTGIAIIDPTNPHDLSAFWNIRASGANVFPWPVGFESRIHEALRAWIRKSAATDTLPQYTSGDGEKGRYLTIWSKEWTDKLPQQVADLLPGQVKAFSTGLYDLRVSPYVNRVVTEIQSRFDISVPPRAHELSVPMPKLIEGQPRGRKGPDGVVAAEITIYTQMHLPVGYTAKIPNIRKIAPLLGRLNNDGGFFARPSRDGIIHAINARSDSLQIRMIEHNSIFSALFKESEWTTGQSDSGRFATRFIERLGGPTSTVGNQPAVRAVLSRAGTSDRGRPIAALIQEVKKHRGDWPRSFTDSDEVIRDYPPTVLKYLLSNKILRAYLPVRCPKCANEDVLAPHALADEIRCEMCSEVFPLGLAIASSKRTDWMYKLAGNMSASRVAETMPIMATLNIIATRSRFSGEVAPYLLGLNFNSKEHKCEIDVATISDDGGLPVAVIGEVKSFRDPIQENDILNLIKVQQYLRGTGIECFVLAATLREELDVTEVEMLRRLFSQTESGTYRGSAMYPMLPIVFTGRDLSAHYLTNNHPLRWGTGIHDMASMAKESCRRNLGLKDSQPVRHNDKNAWVQIWHGSS